MIDVLDNKKMCTGCGACLNVCPRNAIKMIYDSEGFLYPEINHEKCTYCNLCDDICHMKNPNTKVLNHVSSNDVYACYLKDVSKLSAVSSGGVFWALAQEVISQGGVVYGVVQKEIFNVCHTRGENLRECEVFRKSKYLESKVGYTYKEVLIDLQKGMPILFSGTGCQIAGLYGYLRGHVYTNLITCEVVCHGVPSMTVFKAYISELEIKYGSKVKEIIFRDKRYGWDHNHISITLEDGTDICELSSNNLFHGNYLRGIFYRPSCENCKYQNIPRIADLTLADYWAYQGKLRENNQHGGISLVICSSELGKYWFNQIIQYIYAEQRNMNDAVQSCYHLSHSPKVSLLRNIFFALFKRFGYSTSIKILKIPLKMGTVLGKYRL